MNGWAWVNGTIVPEAEARVSVWDRGFLYGDGVFETLRVYGGAPFQLAAHLARLQHGITRLSIAGAPSVQMLEDAVAALLAKATGGTAMLRITVTRGTSPGGWRGETDAHPTVVLVLWPSPRPPETWYAAGVSAVWCDVPMMTAAWWPGDVKHCNWLPRILAKPQVDAAGAAEGFLRTARGTLAEGLTSNVFLVRDGVLCTPALEDGPLPGVTRAVTLRLAKEHKIPVREESIPGACVETAQEVFYTNAGLGLVPVVTFAGKAVGSGGPGPVWQALSDAYRKATGA